MQMQSVIFVVLHSCGINNLRSAANKPLFCVLSSGTGSPRISYTVRS